MVNKEHLKIERHHGGSVDAQGNYDSSVSTVVYDAPVNAQQRSTADMLKRKSLIGQESEGLQELEATVWIALALGKYIGDIKVGDTGTLTWKNGDTDRVHIVAKRRLDQSLEAKIIS